MSQQLTMLSNEFIDVKESLRRDTAARQRRAAELLSTSPGEYTESEIQKVIEAFVQAKHRGIDHDVASLMTSLGEKHKKQADNKYEVR